MLSGAMWSEGGTVAWDKNRMCDQELDILFVSGGVREFVNFGSEMSEL